MIPATAAILAPSRTHASVEAYRAFLQQRNSAGTMRQFSKYQRRFMRMYPDLEGWFSAPLAERVGRLYGEEDQHPSFPISAEARPYLTFLALQGYAWFDWEWLIAMPSIYVWTFLAGTRLAAEVDQLIDSAVQLGYVRRSAERALKWTVTRLFMHTCTLDHTLLTEVLIDALDDAVCRFGDRSDVALFFGSSQGYRTAAHSYRSYLQLTRVVLYHAGYLAREPHRNWTRLPKQTSLPPRMEAVVARYLDIRRLTSRPSTVKGYDLALGVFTRWLLQAHPEVHSFAALQRDHILAYATALNELISTDTGRPLSARTKEGYLLTLATFFRDVTAWEWDEVPRRPLFGPGDIPKRVQHVPRFIPDEELARLMSAIHTLDCPYQKTALLIARWSGARRDEIRRLEIDCLSTYPDGTARLRIPAGKTYQERMIPVHEEAATAIRDLQALRAQEPARGFRDELTGQVQRRLFVHHGKLFSNRYLFESPLQEACVRAGLVTPSGKGTITAHRLRHTVGTQLAERGAKLQTIMSMLGHTSAGMSMVYARISDATVREEYHAVLGPGAMLAGPAAAALRSGELPASTVDWLKTNFFKTELELGHCLRLPQEGPCECDLYLTCAKFVTTPEYAPRLRRRRQVELTLMADAAAHGWPHEVERHRCTVGRLEQLLADLGEPLDGSVTDEWRPEGRRGDE